MIKYDDVSISIFYIFYKIMMRQIINYALWKLCLSDEDDV